MLRQQLTVLHAALQADATTASMINSTSDGSTLKIFLWHITAIVRYAHSTKLLFENRKLLFKISIGITLSLSNRLDSFRHPHFDVFYHFQLANYCVPVSEVPGRHHLRSARCYRLSFPRVRHSTFGTRAFSVAGLTVWNSLPDHLRDRAVGSEQFRRDLKMYLFAGHSKL